MKIEVSEKALAWFIEEVGVEKGSKVRFSTQLYGTSPVQTANELFFTKDDDSRNAAVYSDYDGITFFVDESDLWFFDSHDLFVEYNEANNEVEYKYMRA